MNKNVTLLTILWRSFFIQAIWNFERLQNIGFAFGLLPFFRRLYPEPEKRKEALLRHIGFFNTHPYMVSVILGLVASLEKEKAEGRLVRTEDIAALKNNMAGPLAAIGDTFFWATWRPFIALLSSSVVLFFVKADTFYGTWLAPLSFVVLYNLVPVPFRYWTLKMGYHLRNRIVGIIARFEFNYAVDMIRFIGFVALAILLIFYSWTFAGTMTDRVIFLAVLITTVLLGVFRLTPAILLYGIIALSAGLAYLRGY